MQKIIKKDEIGNYLNYIDKALAEYMKEGNADVLESFQNYNVMSFNWFNLRKKCRFVSEIVIYFDKENLFIICEDVETYQTAEKCFIPNETNEHALYVFFKNMLNGSTQYLEEIEKTIAILDDDVIDGTEKGLRTRIIATRNEILRAKKYYEQLEFLFDEICDNDNELLSKKGLKEFHALYGRSSRIVAEVVNLREYITQVRESYQSQIGLEQNNLLKLFTFITSIFMPLTLIVGWYGMNLKMPEFTWDYGYLFVVGLCVAVSVVWVIIFKKAKWFK